MVQYTEIHQGNPLHKQTHGKKTDNCEWSIMIFLFCYKIANTSFYMCLPYYVSTEASRDINYLESKHFHTILWLSEQSNFQTSKYLGYVVLGD